MCVHVYSDLFIKIIVFILSYSLGIKGSARDGKGWPLRRKAFRLKSLPRAYIKVDCHPPTKRYILLN